MKKWVMVSYDDSKGQLDIWECNKKGCSILDSMQEAFEICVDAIRKKSDSLQYCCTNDYFGMFVLEALRIYNKIELMKEPDNEEEAVK